LQEGGNQVSKKSDNMTTNEGEKGDRRGLCKGGGGFQAGRKKGGRFLQGGGEGKQNSAPKKGELGSVWWNGQDRQKFAERKP